MRPDDSDRYNGLGGFLQCQSKSSDVIAQYQHALLLMPDNARMLCDLGEPTWIQEKPGIYRWPNRR